VKQNLSSVYQFRKTGSGQFLLPGQFYLSPGLVKIAPWWLARRNYFLAKVPGLVSADGATNVYSLNRLAVALRAIFIASGENKPINMSHMSLAAGIECSKLGKPIISIFGSTSHS